MKDREIVCLVLSYNHYLHKRIKYAIIIFKMNGHQMGIGQPGFLLAQLGAHAATQFAEKLKHIDMTPPDAGILRLLRVSPGLSQQELAGRLGIHPSRLVALLDNLEKRGLVERRPNPEDRRLYSLHLTDGGAGALERIGRVAREHQDALLSALSAEERKTLGNLLLRVADQQGLAPGVHPGYQQMGTAMPRATTQLEEDGPRPTRNLQT